MAAQTWNIDPSHSHIQFAVRHMVISKVRGRFNKFSGSLSFDPAAPESGSVQASIEVDSIDTSDEKRDGHLKSPDFFDAANFGTMTFKSTGVTRSGSDLKVTGDLTLHGVTKPVTLEVESLGGGKDPWGGERQGFSAKTSIDRREFGLTWSQTLETGGLLVGDKIEIEIDLEAVKAA
jgi:polyisoprenoid-binding protein YceI